MGSWRIEQKHHRGVITAGLGAAGRGYEMYERDVVLSHTVTHLHIHLLNCNNIQD